MTTPTRLERALPEILGDLSAGPAPDYLDNVFGRTGRMRQRPAWTFPERWLPMADITSSRAFAPVPPWRLIAVALVVITMLVAALLYVGAQERRVPAPFGPARNGLIPYEKNGDIFVGDPTAGTSRLVVGGTEDDHDPGFSPDGTMIAFLRGALMDVDLYTVRLDGSDLRRVTTDAIPNSSWVVWAPDSRHFAVIDLVAGRKRLQVIDSTGSAAPRELAAGLEPDSVTYRPPDAKEILFRTTVDGKFGLSVMDADGTNVRQLIAPADLGDLHLNSFAYSADGTRIFYQRAYTAEEAAATAYPDDRCCKLWVMNADGTGAHEFAGGSGQSWDGLAGPSPDGRWVAFWHVTDVAHLVVMNADGTGSPITTGPTFTGDAIFGWSPDSTKILMVPQDEADIPRHYFLDPAGGTWTFSAWDSQTAPDWQRLAQ